MTMAPPLVQRLQQLHVGDPVEAGGLQVFGLFWEAPRGPNYRTLDEAIQDGVFEVTEVTEGGSVPTLLVHNRDERPVFLMAGEHLSGGKQNRVLNASILVAGHCQLPVPVSCVERGRWAYRSASFAGSGSSSHSTLRRLMHSQVKENLKRKGRHESDQSEVWREVHRKLGETKSVSPSDHLDKAYEDSEPMLRQVIEQLPLPQGACGAAFAYGGMIVGFDLFDRPSTLERLWPKLLRAYAIDARFAKDAPPLTAQQVSDWLKGIQTAQQQVFKSAGLGEDIRLESPTVTAAALEVEGSAVHVEAFAQAV